MPGDAPAVSFATTRLTRYYGQLQLTVTRCDSFLAVKPNHAVKRLFVCFILYVSYTERGLVDLSNNYTRVSTKMEDSNQRISSTTDVKKYI